MFTTAFAPQSNLRSASRLPALSSGAGVSAIEIATLFGCGVLAMVAVVAFQQLRIAVPGHAILRAVLPMAMGLALVPRRSAGMVMTVGAGAAAAAMSIGGWGRIQPAAVLSVLALGPVLDAVLAGEPTGWKLYLRFVTAGALINLCAFAVRLGTAWLGWEMSGGRQFTSFWSIALVSFVLCGALAGLVSAAVWFRLRVDDDLRRA